MAQASDIFKAALGGGARAIDSCNTDPRWDALAREARADERDGVRHLFEAIAPVVRRVCRGVLGHRHPELEDTIQECLVDVVRALPKYRSEGHVLHYVTKIALRRAIRARRRGAQRLRSWRVFEILQGSDVPEPSSEPDAEQSRMVSEVIGRVSGVQRETLMLRVVLGFSIEEVASIMSVPVNTVKARLRLAKNALKRVLEDGHAT